MKKIFSFPILLVVALYMLSSCFSDDDTTYVMYNDTAITAFSVGTLKQEGHTLSSKGEDSVYWTSVDCSGYQFYIDQVERVIYNPDSLPYGIDASKVLCTVTAKSNGIVTIKNVDNDSLSYVTEEDSLDFSQPRTLRVVSYTGLATRDYTVMVNVHQQKADEFAWGLSSVNDALAGLQGMKGFAIGDFVYVVGRDADGARIYRSFIYDAKRWEERTPNVALDADVYRNMAVMGDKAFAYSGGKIWSSADGMVTWTELSTQSFSQLLGASVCRLYALSEDRTIYSSADGVLWEAEAMDSPADMLPETDFSLLCQPLVTNPNVSRLLLAGTTASVSRVWTKVEETDDQAERQPWVYNNVSSDNRYELPNLHNLQVVTYNDALLAVGGSGKGASEGAEAFAKFYVSLDGGLTWRSDTLYNVSDDFVSSDKCFTLVRDANEFLWLICGESGQVWRGRINKLGWRKDQTYFGE